MSCFGVGVTDIIFRTGILLTFLSIFVSFLIYAILARGIAGPASVLYTNGNERIAVGLAFVLLYFFTLIAGFLGGWMSRERIGSLFGGIIAVIYILTYNDHSLISRAIFYAPYANLGSDTVLLGLAITLFNFLWGGKLGEQFGFRKDRKQLLLDEV
jgi:hypothetical protein